MNKFLLFIPLFLFSFDFSLKKDEVLNLEVSYGQFKYELIFRWTLYKNDVLVILYKYDNFPHQVILLKPYLDTLRIKVADFGDFRPHLYIKVINFSDKITKFRIYTDNKKIKFKEK